MAARSSIPLKQALFLLAWSAIFASGATGVASALSAHSVEMVLAASWEPAFCETADGRGKPECRSLTPGRFDATHFSLHGLWPDDLDDKAIFPCYCDTVGGPMSCRESRPSDSDAFVSDDVFAELRTVMPGVRSGLHRYEWTKHGTCYEDDTPGADADSDPDEYFAEAMALLAALNASAVRDLFADNLGATLTRRQIENAFDAAFGDGAGERVLIVCDGSGGDRIVTELRINLAGNVAEPADLSALILAAPPTSVSNTDESCAGGRVVAAP